MVATESKGSAAKAPMSRLHTLAGCSLRAPQRHATPPWAEAPPALRVLAARHRHALQGEGEAGAVLPPTPCCSACHGPCIWSGSMPPAAAVSPGTTHAQEVLGVRCGVAVSQLCSLPLCVWYPQVAALVWAVDVHCFRQAMTPVFTTTAIVAASGPCTARRAQQASAPLHDLTGLHSLTNSATRALTKHCAGKSSDCMFKLPHDWGAAVGLHLPCLLASSLKIETSKDPLMWAPCTLIYHSASGAMHALKPANARSQALGRAQCQPGDRPPRSLDAQPDAALPPSARAAGAAARARRRLGGGRPGLTRRRARAPARRRACPPAPPAARACPAARPSTRPRRPARRRAAAAPGSARAPSRPPARPRAARPPAGRPPRAPCPPAPARGADQGQLARAAALLDLWLAMSRNRCRETRMCCCACCPAPAQSSARDGTCCTGGSSAGLPHVGLQCCSHETDAAACPPSAPVGRTQPGPVLPQLVPRLQSARTHGCEARAPCARRAAWPGRQNARPAARPPRRRRARAAAAPRAAAARAAARTLPHASPLRGRPRSFRQLLKGSRRVRSPGPFRRRGAPVSGRHQECRTIP